MMPRALPVLEEMLSQDDIPPAARLQVAERMDAALGLGLATVTRKDLRVRPAAELDGPRPRRSLSSVDPKHQPSVSRHSPSHCFSAG
jgi:hypothetical protein